MFPDISNPKSSAESDHPQEIFCFHPASIYLLISQVRNIFSKKIVAPVGEPTQLGLFSS